VKEARTLWDAFWDVNPFLPLINWQTIIKSFFFCLKVFIGASLSHWKCQDATTTTTTPTVVMFSHTKNTQNFPKGERKKKGTHTKYCAKFLCKWGGQKLHQRKVCNGRFFFSFHIGCCPFVPPPPKKKNIHNIGFVYLFIYLLKFAMDIPIYAQKKKKKKCTLLGEKNRPSKEKSMEANEAKNQS
jgi:hypothetical protein